MYAGNIIDAVALGANSARESRDVNLYLLVSERILGADIEFTGAQLAVFSTKKETNYPGLLGVFLDQLHDKHEIYIYRDLNAAIDILKIDVIGLTNSDHGRALDIPWMAFLTDFQHQYLVENFSSRELYSRDATFRSKIENCSALLLGSNSAIDDVYRFFPGLAANKPIFQTPNIVKAFARPDRSSFRATSEKFNLKSPYLISCSQRWIHKNHEIIIEAFAKLRRENQETRLKLVFTGATDDYRSIGHRQYIDSKIQEMGIESEVVHTGIVSAKELVSLIQNSSAIIHASSFEGGPGSSGVVEAATLGVPILSSNLRVNKELGFGKFKYFEPRDVNALFRLMREISYENEHEPLFEEAEIEILKAAYGIRLIGTIKSIL